MALFLDFDGTLTEFAPRPEAVEVADGLQTLLSHLQSYLDGALAIVTGRPIQQVDAFLAPMRFPAAGLHGLELRLEREATARLRAPSPEILVLKERLAASDVLKRGALLEDKGPAVALHYRAVPDLASQVADLMQQAVEDLPSLHLVSGKMVIEAKPDTSNKGAALNVLMQQKVFAGRRPVFIGDDTTDEDGMKAARAHGGFGIKVGQGETDAAYRLPDVAAVHNWLSSQAYLTET